MKREVDVKVNGEQYSVVVDTRETLLDVLRYRLGFMGTKEGCGNGNCGSCTIHLNGATANSCLVFAVEDGWSRGHHGGRDRGKWQTSSRATGIHRAWGVAVWFLYTRLYHVGHGAPGAKTQSHWHEIRLALAGNLCRCTGYDKIVRAVMAASQAKITKQGKSLRTVFRAICLPSSGRS